jgi:acyl carrier protein
MLKQVAAILSTVVETDPDTITEGNNLGDDLGLSSLDVINLVVMFEQEFDIEIPDRHIMKFVTVGDIVTYLQERKTSV